MKDIILTERRQKIEITWFIVCLLLALLLNVYSIIAFGTEWKELWTQSVWMLVIGCGLYVLSICVRLLFSVFSRKKKRRR